MTVTKQFDQLNLSKNVLSALKDLGYETPTPIQEESIPILIEGGDILAQAQTGTGKTAAFALPILSNLYVSLMEPQALVITPTRELAIQVAEAFQSYAKHIDGFHVAPIYGGQDYSVQLRALRRGVHVVVGTPGRLIDHLKKGKISLDSLKTIVLDEADEMLNMGFVDDIEWILKQIPNDHQSALFSATMPPTIQKIAKRYLKDFKKIQIVPTEKAANSIKQLYVRVSRNHKLDVLTRFLEVEDTEAVIIFVRTKTISTQLAQKLQARGYACAALNGDMNQSVRKSVVDKIKKGSLDIIVATDLAARGIDVARVTHVINFDIPHDTESYVHRIGRTGRAGRTGTALLFVTPREHRLLRDIEKNVHGEINQIAPPSIEQLKDKRSQTLAYKVSGVISKSNKLEMYQSMIEDIVKNTDASHADIAAALAYLMQQSNPLPTNEVASAEAEEDEPRRRGSRQRGSRSGSGGNGGNRRSNSNSSRSYAGKSSNRRDERSSEGRSQGRSNGSRGSSGSSRPGNFRSSEDGRSGNSRGNSRSEGSRYGSGNSDSNSRGNSEGRSSQNSSSRSNGSRFGSVSGSGGRSSYGNRDSGRAEGGRSSYGNRDNNRAEGGRSDGGRSSYCNRDSGRSEGGRS